MGISTTAQNSQEPMESPRFPFTFLNLRTQIVASDRPRLASQLSGCRTNYIALSLSFFKSKVEIVNVQILVIYFTPRPFPLPTSKLNDHNLKLKGEENGSVPAL